MGPKMSRDIVGSKMSTGKMCSTRKPNPLSFPMSVTTVIPEITMTIQKQTLKRSHLSRKENRDYLMISKAFFLSKYMICISLVVLFRTLKMFLKMWILWQKSLRKCEFCEKGGFENANFVKNLILNLWISCEKKWFWKCEFCEKGGSKNVNSVNNGIFSSGILENVCRDHKTNNFTKWNNPPTTFHLHTPI